MEEAPNVFIFVTLFWRTKRASVERYQRAFGVRNLDADRFPGLAVEKRGLSERRG